VIPNAERKPLGFGFWLVWVLATTLSEVIKRLIGEAPSEWETFVVGTSVGLAQWLVLRHHLAVARWFVLASGFGLLFGFVFAALSVDYRNPTSPAVVGAITGMLVGVAQSGTMRRDATRLSDFVRPSLIAKAVKDKQWIAPQFGWLLATVVGVALGLAASDVVSNTPLRLGLGYSATNTLGRLLEPLAAGGSVGVAQWLVLRRRIPEARWWVWATIVGVTIGLALVEREGTIERSAFVARGASIGLAQLVVIRWRFPEIPQVRWWVPITALGFTLGYLGVMELPLVLFSSRILGSSVSDIFVGGVVGLVQWFVLRRRVSNAGKWVLASAIGQWIGFTSVETVGHAVGGNFEAYALGSFGAAAALAIYGMITGAALIRLRSRMSSAEIRLQNAQVSANPA
jgi:hypothetical protein